MVFVAWTSFILQKAGFLHSSIVRVRAFLLSHFLLVIFLGANVLHCFACFHSDRTTICEHKNARPNGIIELRVLIASPIIISLALLLTQLAKRKRIHICIYSCFLFYLFSTCLDWKSSEFTVEYTRGDGCGIYERTISANSLKTTKKQSKQQST